MDTNVHIGTVEITTQVVGKTLFLTIAEAAAETRYSESYLRKLIDEGKLPSFKGDGNNGRVRIRTDELLAFMETLRVTNPSR
ncbi:MAG: helix-turn-helix domain-containing protein [Candidatus Latescibacteria bacterium]|mgnify:CR=1 FL=1|jgi:excisionase family DNA binding protein|nr:helix-turn-helix domain-containing protein [Candidatus Latescibacterota bacterium]